MHVLNVLEVQNIIFFFYLLQKSFDFRYILKDVDSYYLR